MIRVENTEVYGWEAAIRGMRNPKNSWDLSDTNWEKYYSSYPHDINRCLGGKDLKLMKILSNAGTDHGKFMRYINVTCDITCNHTWWAEFDTYKVSTVRNSCSKMHKIHVKSFEPDDFSHEGIDEVGGFVQVHFEKTLNILEKLRIKFNETQEKKYWRAMIELLPMGYNIKATIQFNYAVLRNMYHARKNHKMFEWIDFCQWIERLPYASELIVGDDNE